MMRSSAAITAVVDRPRGVTPERRRIARRRALRAVHAWSCVAGGVAISCRRAPAYGDTDGAGAAGAPSVIDTGDADARGSRQDRRRDQRASLATPQRHLSGPAASRLRPDRASCSRQRGAQVVGFSTAQRVGHGHVRRRDTSQRLRADSPEWPRYSRAGSATVRVPGGLPRGRASDMVGRGYTGGKRTGRQCRWCRARRK